MDADTLEYFVDCLRYGERLRFRYRGIDYETDTWFDEEKNYRGCLSVWGNNPSGDGIFYAMGRGRSFPVTKFLKTPIWGGKTFIEVAGEIEWTNESEVTRNLYGHY